MQKTHLIPAMRSRDLTYRHIFFKRSRDLAYVEIANGQSEPRAPASGAVVNVTPYRLLARAAPFVRWQYLLIRHLAE